MLYANNVTVSSVCIAAACICVDTISGHDRSTLHGECNQDHHITIVTAPACYPANMIPHHMTVHVECVKAIISYLLLLATVPTFNQAR